MTRRTRLAFAIAVAGTAVLAADGLSLPAEPPQQPSFGPRVAHRPLPGPDSLVGVFEGRTPCGSVATDFTGFPARNCEKIKWRLTLYRDSASGEPTTYLFEGTRTTREGRWRIQGGTGADRARVIYHLDYDGPGKVLSLLSIDDDVLLLLDRDLKVLVGDASWSYVLNRIDSGDR